VVSAHEDSPAGRTTIAGPGDLGFRGSGHDGPWIADWGGSELEFRLLRTLDELAPVEVLQREVFGVSDADLIAATALIVFAETGGEVIGAFDPSGDRLLGFSTAIGGFVDRRPRLCSDMLAVHPEARNRGIGLALKRLQAGLAIARGFEEIVWTVDPLRAANARLNFERLGSYAGRYERNRYGTTYGEDHYGGLPTDRLHITWPILTSWAQERLTGAAGGSPQEWLGAPLLRDVPQASVAAISLPEHIDDLVQVDPAAALDWRLRVRGSLEPALAMGYVVAGFRTTAEGPALLVVRGFDRYLQS
jgi:predicted GNAT superfamily acetyltransferase